MDHAQKLKISQCLAFGLLFQYLGWLLKGLEVDEKSVILGGKVTFILSFVLLIWGGLLFAHARGLMARKGTWRTVGLVLLGIGGWALFTALAMKLGEPLWLHKRFTGLLLLVAAEGWILNWLHGRGAEGTTPSRNSSSPV